MTVVLLKQKGDKLPPEKKEGILIYDASETGIQSILIKKDVATIGRGSDSDIKTTVGSVSRKHCSLIKRDDGWYIIDHKSKAGTFIYRSLGGRREFVIQLISGEFPLQYGDHISLGGLMDAAPVLVFNFVSK
jgi:pSer/pThr/pTyr-binding forkhead associated (FHA) protein